MRIGRGLAERGLQAVILGCVLALPAGPAFGAASSYCRSIAENTGGVIWCDSFEFEDLPESGVIADSYDEFDPAGETFRVTDSEAFEGQWSLMQEFYPGQTEAGALRRYFGRNPLGSELAPEQNFDEVYWRFYVKYASPPPFPQELTRVAIIADEQNARVASGDVRVTNDGEHLQIEAKSRLATGGDNAAAGETETSPLQNIAFQKASRRLQPDTWYCVEAHARLNSPGSADGTFELRLDQQFVAEISGLEWVNDADGYGLNVVTIAGQRDVGAPDYQRRFIDALVIATDPIGCNGQNVPKAPVLGFGAR